MAVLREARAQGITTPALFLTAKAEIEDRVTGLDAGADDYLPKPFDASEMEVIWTYIGFLRKKLRQIGADIEIKTIRSLLFITLAVAGGSLLLVFALVVLFSGRAIAPYLRNLAAQKQFITNASHELKTPLTAISTSANVLAMESGENEWV